MQTQSTKRDDIAAKAREICSDTKVKAAWTASWNRIIDYLEPTFKAREGIKSFEVRHTLEKAREAFLRAAVAGTDLDECERAAIAAVTQ
jgi:hypothetical protein